MQKQLGLAIMKVRKDAVDPLRIETAGTPLDAVNFISLRKQKLRQVGTILPGDPSTIPNTRISCHNLTPAEIGETLKSWDYLDHEIVDSTGLDGTYDFDLEWTNVSTLALKGADGIPLLTAV